jgi:hypothetical protein
MARRGRHRHGTRHHEHDDRPFTLGTHWRADGSPKSSFATQAQAAGAADERRLATGVELNVYECDICRGWHMGKGRDDQ